MIKVRNDNISWYTSRRNTLYPTHSRAQANQMISVNIGKWDQLTVVLKSLEISSEKNVSNNFFKKKKKQAEKLMATV